ncbi:protein VAC14 homolog [Daphnia pulicaria]|uniref:protein VAC14 homolog n=1 Tax=Daphnia pulicaria TaxID=35523 RepID=UPI001EEBF846|nr:protein VAC14 homolog [Daphnia pulicaria]
MSEKDYAPLSAACVRALSDKLYEKRKAAALEIEKMTKEFSTVNNTIQIKKLLRVLSQEFAVSQNPHTRKGGLIGLAAMAIALGKDTNLYMEELVRPILACFLDTDSRVRYYACESLYNVAKVGRGALLPQFNEVFDVLAKLVADPDQNVKSGAELLDRLLKDIVTESACFDVTAFMPLLRERIYTRNTFTRQFLISWLSVLHSVPHLDLLTFLPDILDGLFTILEDPTMEIKKMCESLLGEFLRSIIENPKHVDFPSMINILIHHSQSSDELSRYTAVTWISEFAILSGPAILPYTSGILTAILPCMAYDDDSKKDLRETTRIVNSNLMRLVDSDSEKNMELGSVVLVLDQHLTHNSVHTKVAVLKWIEHLLSHLPNSILPHTEKLFPVLLNNLSDPADQVVILTVQALAHIANAKANDAKGDSYFLKFMKSLLALFSSDNGMQEERWAFIIRQLCVLLSAEDIYRTFAEILIEEKNCRFASVMVETLSTLLLTSSELFPLRRKLKDLSTEESCNLFEMLYKCWCHNPVATVALCLLTQNYLQASNLIRHFGNLEVTVDFLTEIDQLVQLIESPIFAYLRIELLEPEKNGPIVHTLYGLLMLLPQSEAFHTLRRRLECVAHLRPLADDRNVRQSEDKRPHAKAIDFQKLTDHFVRIQEKHCQYELETRIAGMSNHK